MLAADELSTKFKTDGMLAYVNLVQKREKELGCDVLTHQKWSGASYVDRILNSTSIRFVRTRTERALQGISAGSSATAASGKDSTETQFH